MHKINTPLRSHKAQTGSGNALLAVCKADNLFCKMFNQHVTNKQRNE